MGGTVAEQYTIRNDGGATATHLQHTDEQADKQQFSFLGLGDGKQRLAHRLIVEAARERWVGQAQGISVLVGVVGREAVPILDVGIVNPVQHQVHCTDTQHREVGVEAVQHLVLVVVGILLLQQFGLVMLTHILGTLDDKTRTTHSRVTDGVLQGGLHDFNHHADDVSRCTELTVVARSRHLAEHILIDIAHRVTVVHVKMVDTLDNLGEGTGALNQEGRILHETAVGRLLAATQVLDEHKHVLADDAVHRLGVIVLERAPPQIFVGDVAVSLRIVPRPIADSRLRHCHTHSVGIGFLGALCIVEHLHKEQIGHLLENGDGIGDASGPKGVPNTVYSILDFSCYHWLGVISLNHKDSHYRHKVPTKGQTF